MYQFLCTVVAIWLIFSYVTQDIASSSDSSISNQVTSPKFVPSELPSAFENSLEKCVTLAFDDHPLSRGPAPKLAMVTDDKKKSVDWDSIVCKDILRMVNVYRRDNGYLPSYYVEALEKVPKFKNDKYALNRFLCRMDPHNNYLGVPCPDLFSGITCNVLEIVRP
ncbi:OLC1v1035187C1 [Oldenlandia corymbosa var. corymbosa]|uniref:OLC1v1035187C1 n=1 Tax=Oldenlandia corymbosa var. corymbosa TaxID=529605 RepID=A0AAV1CVM3_OLDCO|nr:OLC1v1035187C1 [Oldenlandia corymbosa var. corymbosa]